MGKEQLPVPIVRVLVRDDDGQVLLLRRASGTAGGGQWCLPGGKVDYGETAEAAAARELWEETGLVWKAGAFALFQDSLPLHPGSMHCVNLYFVARAQGPVHINKESEKAAWFSPDSLENLDIAFRNKEAILEILRRCDQTLMSIQEESWKI